MIDDEDKRREDAAEAGGPETPETSNDGDEAQHDADAEDSLREEPDVEKEEAVDPLLDEEGSQDPQVSDPGPNVDDEKAGEPTEPEGSTADDGQSRTEADDTQATEPLAPEGDEQRTVFQPPAEDSSPAGTPEQRTVFQPPTDSAPPTSGSEDQQTVFQAPSPPPPGPGDEEQRTVFQPPANKAQPVEPALPTSFPQAYDGTPGRRIKVGDTLNHIFEVRRFIARGGMGEVFEGINVQTEERVAIKAILPHLAADQAVQAMFLKEARTLTKLNHEGLVQYRVLAMEPQLKALYIVTDYVDGINLSDHLADVDKSPEAVRGLLKKLAKALQNAHALGAIHRDISPDNIMLEGGKLAGAKIIDFGIAKDLDPGGQTVVGDGFAGKLNYVAPEQLGDFNRNVGPWTDVYSLALTILAVLRGRDVDMGATLVEAVDRRREGVDMSGVEDPELRAVLTAMLRPDPAERPQSMNAVIDLLGGSTGETTFEPSGAEAPAGGFLDKVKANPAAALGVTVGIMSLIVGLLNLVSNSDNGAGDGTVADGDAVPQGPVEPPENPLEAAQAAVEQEFRTLPCSWLDIENVTAAGTDISLQLRGVSGKSADALERIEKSLARIGLRAASIDFSDVSPIQANTCRPLEAFLEVRSEGVQRLDASQRKFEMNILPASAGEDSGKLGGQAVITVDLADLAENVTLIGIDETGEMTQFAPNKQVIVENAEAMGSDSYRFTLNTTHSGWSGILMLIGRAPFPESLLTSSSANRAADWPEKFKALAEAQGWKSEMVWYRTVDEVANSR